MTQSIFENNQDYKVSLANFEGPLELLLELIKDQEINIYDIPIADITKQYIDFINFFQKLNMDVSSEFIVMAATLLMIKSKMMLPVELEQDKDNEIDDPRKDLVKQLLEYQRYKQLASKLENMDLHAARIIERKDHQITFDIDKEDDLWQEVKLIDLIKVFSGVVDAINTDQFHVLQEEELSVEDKIEDISRRLSEGKSINFYTLFSEKKNRNEVIVTFWAILEMVKMKKISIRQHSLFGDIHIFKKEEVNNSEQADEKKD